MDKSEKKRDRERNKKLRKQYKEYARQERESLRRQKQEEKKLRSIRRRHSTQGRSGWFKRIKVLLTGSGEKKESSQSLKRPGFWKRIRLRIAESRSIRKNKREAARKIKFLNKNRKQQIIAQKKSIRLERKKMQVKTRPLKKRIRSARIQKLKTEFRKSISELFQPAPQKPDEALLREQIKEDIRRQRLREFREIPKTMTARWNFFVTKRHLALQFIWFTIQEQFAGIKLLRTDPALKAGFIKTSLNSLILFIFSFQLAYFGSQLFTIFIANQFDIPAVLYSYRIFWPLYTYSSLYTRLALVLIFGSGPLLSLAAAFLLYRVYLVLRGYSLNAKLLVAWLIFHCLNLYFGAYIAGAITRTGFIYASEWIFYSQIFDIEEIIFFSISILSLIVFGFMFTRIMIYSTSSAALIDPSIRVFYFIAQVYIPWMVGTLFITLLNHPYYPPELMILYGSSVLMIIPTLINFNSLPNQWIKIVLKGKGLTIGWIYLIILIVFVIYLRIVLIQGIDFK